MMEDAKMEDMVRKKKGECAPSARQANTCHHFAKLQAGQDKLYVVMQMMVVVMVMLVVVDVVGVHLVLKLSLVKAVMVVTVMSELACVFVVKYRRREHLVNGPSMCTIIKC
jgi:hypothetical protein